MEALGSLGDELSCIKNLENNLKETECLFNQVNVITAEQLKENASPLDKAMLDIATSQAVHSLFKIYLQITGGDRFADCVDRVKELERYTSLAKEIKDRKNAPRLDMEASARFIGHSLKNKDIIKHSKKRKREPLDNSKS